MHIVRVATVYDPEVDALPPEFRGALTEQDAAAIRTGPEFFAALAGPDDPKWLRDVLGKCAESGYELQFLSSGDSPYRPFFRFQWLGTPAISLPRDKPLRADMPAFLARLYGVIGSFIENDFDMAGGLHSGTGLEPMSESGIWIEPGGPVDPATAINFLETFSGSQLCYLLDGGGAWLEAGQFRRVEDLEGEVARYFEALLDGTRI